MLDGVHVVGDQDDRPPLVVQFAEHVEALLLERGVADRQHLVDEQDVGVDLRHQREPEPDQHPRGVVLQLQVGELPELGEVDDLVQPAARLARREAHHHAVEDHVLVR